MTQSFPDDRESTRGLIDKLTPPGSPEEFLVAAAQDIAGVGIWKWDLRAERVMWSVGLQKLYGYEAGEFAGTVDAFLGHLLPDDRDRVWGHVQRSLQTLEPFAFEERIRRTDGKVRVLLSRGQPYFDAPGNLRGLMGVCHDVTEIGRAQEGLGTLEQRLRSIVDNTPSVITVKDLDGFYMMVNQECARLLGLSPQDIVRHKCTEIFPPDLAATIAEADHIAASRNEHVYRDVEFQDRVYTSVTFPLPNGMGLPCATCTIATDISERSEREAERLARDATQRRIIMAIAENRLRCYAQPIMPLGDKPPKWELLARLREDGSDLAPPAWLPDAEQADIVVEVDVWMTAQAIKLAERGWHVNVNWSASTLCDERARRRLREVLAATDACGLIEFELTETAVIENLEMVKEFAVELSEMGCGLALDDFGTGWGSFTYLRHLPAAVLKIDTSFVRTMLHDEDDRKIVEAVVGLARTWNLRTVAEGVEDPETLAELRKLGCDYAQGWAIGRPRFIEDIAAHQALVSGEPGS